MWKSRLSYVGLLVVFALALQGWLSFSAQTADAQIVVGAKPAPAPPPPLGDSTTKGEEPTEFTDRVKLPQDRTAKRKIEESIRLVNEDPPAWGDAVALLQTVLDVQEDLFMKDEKGRWVSVRAEANRIIGSLPRHGLQFYEQKFGIDARRLLDKGKAAGDPHIYAEVALRYMHTDAGAEAAGMLGTYHLDHGRYIVAALCYERLLQREGVTEKIEPLTLYKAALAFRRADDDKNFEKVWTEFAKRFAKDNKSMPMPYRRWEPAQLKDLLVRKESAPLRDRFDWPTFLGDPSRSGVAEGGAPFLKHRWKHETVASPQSKGLMEKPFNSPTSKARAMLGGSHPIAVGDKIIFRASNGIHVRNIRTGETEWFDDKSPWTLEKVLTPNNIDNTGNLSQWLQQYMQTSAALLYDNSLLGTLSSDNLRVYVIEDLPVPPTWQFLQNMRFGMQGIRFSPQFAETFQNNKLVAYNLEKGTLGWKIPADLKDRDPNNEDPFADHFFLGAPLPMGDKLYVLAEVNTEIRLLCLHPYTEQVQVGEKLKDLERVKLAWSQMLCSVDRPITQDPLRRTQAVHLAYGEGILVCPTNSGAVLAVDLLNRSMIWAHSYGEATDTTYDPRRGGRYPQPAMAATWANSAPMVRDGKVVFTAPDGKHIHCLNLRDGSPLWKEDKSAEDLYLAGIYDGKVLLVGKDSCRALNLKDGKQAWSVATAQPSGRGVASKNNIYYLPTRTGEVLAINLETREIARSKSPEGEVPGNLIFHDGDVLSQTMTAVLAYPQLEVMERQIAEKLKNNPNDPDGLTKLGEYLLFQGKLTEAADNLRKAMKNDPPEHLNRLARRNLHEALTGLLERNFNQYQDSLEELKGLLPIPESANETDEAKAKRLEEQRDRDARFLRLVAKGREEQAFSGQPEKLQDAFDAYLKFAALGSTELIAIPEEAGTRVLPELWAQGRISAMIRRAGKEKPEIKKALEDALQAQWRKAEKEDSLEALRSFVTLFGPLSEQGQKAKLLLADKLIEAKLNVEAETTLWALYDQDKAGESVIAARALDMLARLHTRMGELENAIYYYQLLAQKYPRLVVRDGKTGENLFQELAMDKRYLVFLGGASYGWMNAKDMKVSTAAGNFQQQQYIWLEPEGEAPPSLRRYRIGMNFNTTPTQARLQDRSTGESLQTFTMKGLRPYWNTGVPGQKAQFTYKLIGRIMVYQWGHWVYGYDPLQRKELWSYNLLGLLNPNPNGMIGNYMSVSMQIMPNGVMELYYSDGVRERVGTLGVADANCVCFLVKDEGLVAVDPSTGQKRWVKADVPIGTEVFGDGQYIYLVPAKGEGTRAKALRALDGAEVPVQDFSNVYQNFRVKTVGRNLLLRETDPQGGLTLRLYDVQTGKDAWNKSFGANALLLNSDEPELAGVIDAAGKLTVIRIDTGREVLRGEVDAADLQAAGRLPEAHLLADSTNYYVFFNQPVNANPRMAGGRVLQPYNVLIRNLTVNGNAYAFDRVTGKQLWKVDLPLNSLLVDQFDDMPILLFASLQTVWLQNPAGRQQQSDVILALDKREADKEPIYKYEQQSRGYQFFGLKVDPRGGTIELISYQMKWIFSVSGDRAVMKPANPDKRGPKDDLPPDQPIIRPPIRIQPDLPIQPPERLELEKIRRLIEEKEREAELLRKIEEIKRDKEGLDRQKFEELRKVREEIEKRKELDRLLPR